MAVDRYTKAVLTVIAACLVWLSIGSQSFTTPVNAQTGYERVIVAGWMDQKGVERPFPAPYWAGKEKTEPDKLGAPSPLPIWNSNP